MKQHYWVGLGDWIAATPQQRADTEVWCKENGYILGLDIKQATPRQLNRETQADYDDEADAQGVNTAELLTTQRQSGGLGR